MEACFGKCLLIVDDEPDIRELLRDTFKRDFESISEASNVAEALEIYQGQEITAVITDVRMPGRSGMALIKELCSSRLDLPIVVLSAYSDYRLEEAYELGAVALLRKPPDLDTIRGVIARALSPLQTVPILPTQESIFEISLPNGTSVQWQLGRGGVFIAGSFDKIVSREVIFRLPPSDGGTPFEGQGLVKWQRAKAADPFQAGVGIEFTLLTESSKTWLFNEVQRQRWAGYIPRGRI